MTAPKTPGGCAVTPKPGTDEAEYEYAVSCGLHKMCDPKKAQPLFGVFKTAAEARARADFLKGRVMQRQIGGWSSWLDLLPASSSVLGVGGLGSE